MWDPGYRVYFGIDGTGIILLGGGDKRTQKSDFKKAREWWVGTTMPKRTTAFRDDLLADLADPQEAAYYLNAALEDSEEMFLVALRDVAAAKQMGQSNIW
jgi:hypothetical protein